VWVKVCGVRTVAQARHAEACGADAIGLNLHPPSARFVPPDQAADIAASVGLEVVVVVVDRSATELAALVAEVRPDTVQLHGSEGPALAAALAVPAYRAFRAHAGVEDEIRAWGPDRFLLDAHVPGLPGGTGRRVDEALACRCASLGALVLAGGLRPDNVAAIASRVRPFGVDAASGLESSPGVQDPDRVRAFVAAARSLTG